MSSAFGTFAIVWWEGEMGPRVSRILLPDEQKSVECIIQTAFADSSELSCPAISEIGERIQRFFQGEVVDFRLDIVALERCSTFQKKVLLKVHYIPRGQVSTYGNIARDLGVLGGARAVGGALAHNPFPIIIPCHRVIGSDGRLGGFQSGLRMKQDFLKLEGVKFSRTGKILQNGVYF